MSVSVWFRRWSLIACALLMATGFIVASPSPAQADETAPPKVLLLLDVSGSMNGKISGGGTKFAAAKRALKQVAASLPPGTQVGLRVYGSKIAEDQSVNPKACTDTQLVLPIGPLDTAKMSKAVDSFEAKGETPIAYSLGKSVDDLGDTGKRILVLISDGQETCAKDPCPTAEKLAKSGVDLQFNAIGLAVGSKARKQLQCIADAGGGSYYDAGRADELSDALRKITQRALRPFQLSGTPVQGAADQAAAPEIQVGQYLDRYDSSKTQRFYRVNRTPGATVTASITSLLKGRGSGGFDSWGMELWTESGTRCGAESVNVGGYDRVVVLAGAVSSFSPTGSNPPTVDGCATEPLLLGLIRKPVMAAARSVPVEIRIAEEPAITNLASLPKSVTSYDVKPKKVAASPSPKAVVGGSSFSNAADVTPGSWRDSLAVGETMLYRVRVETGQRLRVSVDAPVPRSSWSLRGAETIAPDLQLYAPSRVELGQRRFAVLQATRSVALTATTPEVRVRNREFTSITGEDIRASSIAGDYYIAVGLQPGQAELTGLVMPFRLSIAVDGQPTGQPVYAVASPEPTPSTTPVGGATPGSADPPSTQAQPRSGQSRLGLFVGLGALAIVVVGAGVLLARRRSHQP